MDLYMHSIMMFVPATLGLLLFVFLLFLCFRKQLPRKLHVKRHAGGGMHPLSRTLISPADIHKRNKVMRNVLLFVFTVRVALFVASYLGIPIEIVALLGSVILLSWRWAVLKIKPTDLLKKTPWHILIFAFAMYVLIYGLHNIGLTEFLIQFFEPIVSTDLLNASLLMGGLLSLLSILFNNHPALMVGTITLTNMNLDPLTLKISYLASVIGSDIGALLLPMGTLASLIWLHILKQHHVKIKWKEYIKITILTIPPTLLFTLVILAFWVQWVY